MTVEALRFASEVAAVVVLALAGDGLWAWVLPIALVLTWGAFVAPKAQRRLLDPWRLALEVALFAGVAVVAGGGWGSAAAIAGAVLSGAMRTVGSQA